MGIFRSVRPKLVSVERPSQSALGPKGAFPQAFRPSATHRQGLAHTASPARRGRPLPLASPAQIWLGRGQAKFLVVPSSRSLGQAASASPVRSEKYPLPPLSKAGTNLRQSTTKAHLCSSSFFVDIFQRSRPQAPRSDKHPVALKYTNSDSQAQRQPNATKPTASLYLWQSG